MSINVNPAEIVAGNPVLKFNLGEVKKSKKGKLYNECTYRNPKLDALYSQNPMIKIIDGFFTINPIAANPLLAQLGTLDLRDVAINQRYVQFEAMVAKSAISVNDDLLLVHGDSQPYPAIWKAKIFQFGCALSELDYRALMSGNGAGASLIRAKVEAEIQASYGRMQETMLNWLHGFTTTFTSDIEYDPAWKPLFANKAATGTAGDPEDINATPGTTTTQSYNLTGTNKSKDFVLNTVGAALKRFTAMRDSTTGEAMLRPNGNSFIMMCNPDLVTDLSLIHPTNGVQDDMNVTYADQIRAAGVSQIIGSYQTDAAYANAEDGTLQYQIIANPADNFKIGMISEYVIEDWMPQVIEGTIRYFKRAWLKLVPFIRPYYVNGAWKKAMTSAQFVYKNDSG